MDEILSLEFTYRSKTYYALVRTKKNEGIKRHHITIMNGALERLLYGYHIITEKENGALSTRDPTDPEITGLKQSVMHAFCRRLEISNPFYGEENYLNDLYLIE